MERKTEPQTAFDSLSPTIRDFLRAGVFTSVEEALNYQKTFLAEQQTVQHAKPPAQPAINFSTSSVENLGQYLGLDPSEATTHLAETVALLKKTPPMQHLILFLLLKKIPIPEALSINNLNKLKISSLSYWLLVHKIELRDIGSFIDNPDILSLFERLNLADLTFFSEHFSQYVSHLSHTEDIPSPSTYFHAPSQLKTDAGIRVESSTLQQLIFHRLATEQDIENLNATEYKTALEYLPWILYTRQPLHYSLDRLTQIQRLAQEKELYSCVWLYALDRIALEQLAVLSAEHIRLVSNIIQLLILGLISDEQLFMILFSEEPVFAYHFSAIQTALTSLNPADLQFICQQAYPNLHQPLSPSDLPDGITIEDLLAQESAMCADLLREIIHNLRQSNLSNAKSTTYANSPSILGTDIQPNKALYRRKIHDLPALEADEYDVNQTWPIPAAAVEGKPFASSYQTILHTLENSSTTKAAVLSTPSELPASLAQATDIKSSDTSCIVRELQQKDECGHEEDMSNTEYRGTLTRK